MAYRARNEDAVEAVISARDIMAAEYWHVMRTPPAREVDAGVLLHNLGFTVYCPRGVAWKRVGRGGRLRKRPANEPAFGHYIFVGFREGGPSWSMLFKTGYIRALVGLNGKPFIVRPGEVAAIARRQRVGDFDDQDARTSRAIDIAPGERIRVEEGPFRGYYFRAETVREDRIGALVGMFGQLNFVEFTLDQVSKAA